VAALDFRDFSHITVRVSDMERSLAFYRDGLGLRVIFDVRSTARGSRRSRDRRARRAAWSGCSCRARAASRSSCSASSTPKSERPPQGRFTGYSNISLSVDDLDAAHAACVARGLRPLQKPSTWAACACSSSPIRTARRSS
jgi:glyoxylase I family protein